MAFFDQNDTSSGHIVYKHAILFRKYIIKKPQNSKQHNKQKEKNKYSKAWENEPKENKYG
jgi:hypothetical protein